MPYMDAFGTMLRAALSGGSNAGEWRQQVLESLREQDAQIRDLEMTISHYKAQMQQAVTRSAESPDLAVRLRSAEQAVTLQEVITDLERRAAGLKAAQRSLVLRLDL
jgi:uncharacterized protein YgfB (UPF0149 family)